MILIIVLVALGCESIPPTNLGFCYEDDGKQYCGEIGFNQAKSEKEGSIVIDRKLEGAEDDELFTFTGEEVRVLASQLSNMNAPDGVSMQSKTPGKQPSYMKASLSDVQKCKEYCKLQLEE